MENETQNPIEQIQLLKPLLPEKKQEDLAQILAFGEKYKQDSTNAECNFWSTYGLEEYKNLLSQYEGSKQKFLAGLTPQEKNILDSIPVTVRDKFFRQYLFNWIVYSGDAENEDSTQPAIRVNSGLKFMGPEEAKAFAKEWKDKLQPGMTISLMLNYIGDEGAKAIAKEWRDNLQPGMEIDLMHNQIGPEGAKSIAKEWRDNLQPGMEIGLSSNQIGYEGAIAIAKEWKDSLRPGMQIDLSINKIGPEGVMAIAKNWKNSLQPGMRIDLNANEIGNEGVKTITEFWKDKLQPRMAINLSQNKIGDDGAEIIKSIIMKDGVTIVLAFNNISKEKKKKLKDWEKSYHDKGINCKVLVEDEEFFKW